MGWPIWGRFPAEGRDFSFLQNIQPQSRAHLAFYSMGNEVFFPGVKWSVRELPSCHWLVLKLQMSDAVPLFPLCAFMACTKTDYLFFNFFNLWSSKNSNTILSLHTKTVYTGMTICVCTSAQSVEMFTCFKSDITGWILINFRVNVVPLVVTMNWYSLISYFSNSSVAVTWIYGVGATLPHLHSVVIVNKWQQ